MNRIITVPVKDIITEQRFNPKYFYFYESKKNMENNNGLDFKKLGNKDYIELLTDGIHSAVSLQKEGEIKYLYVKNLKEGFLDVTDNIYIDPADILKNKNKILEPNDILLSVVGRLGESAMVSNYLNIETSLPRNIAFMRTNKKTNLIKPEFLTCFFLSKFAKEQSIFSGGGNIQGLLSLTKLKKFIFPVPSMDIQDQFVKLYQKALLLQEEILDNIHSAKVLLSETLDVDNELKKKKLSFSTHASEIRSNSIWTPNLYNKNVIKTFETYNTKYEMRSLSELSIPFKKGKEIGSENYKDYLAKSKDDIPFIRTSDIYNYEISSYPSYYANNDLRSELNQDFLEGDIIVNNDGRIGYVAMITSKDKGIYQSHIQRLRMKDEYKHLSNYVYICLLSEDIGGIQFKKNTVIQTTIPTLSNRLKNFIIPLVDNETIKIINEKVDKSMQAIVEKDVIIKKIKKEMNLLLDYY